MPAGMRRGALAALTDHRTFRIYWLGQAVSLTGLWMQQVAQAWVIVSLTTSTTAIATVAFVASLPALALSMPAGVLADRRDRRRILMVTQVLLASLAFAYAALVASGELTLAHVYLLAAGLGAVAAFDLPANQALVPELVPKPAIPQAVALNQSLLHGTRLVGPALAGVLMAHTSVAAAFVANGLSYFATIASLIAIRHAPLRGGVPRARHAGAGGLREALRFVRGHREVRALIGFTALFAMMVFPLYVVFLGLFVKAELRGDEGALGTLMSISGLGAMTGALLLLRVPGRLRRRLIVVTAGLSAILLFVLSRSTTVWAAALLVGALTLCSSLGLGLGNTLVQMAVPSALRGRIMGLYGVMFTGLMPSAALALGGLADAIGLRTTLGLMAGALGTLVVPWLLRARMWRLGTDDDVAGEGVDVGAEASRPSAAPGLAPVAGHPAPADASAPEPLRDPVDDPSPRGAT